MTDASNPQDPKPERISVRHMFEVLLSAFNLDRGLGYTLKALLIHPKKAVEEYLFEDRKRMVHPLRFLFLTTAIAAFLNIQYVMNSKDFQEGYLMGTQLYQKGEAVEGDMELEQKQEKLNAVTTALLTEFVDFLANYQNILLLLFVPVAALTSWLFFRKRKWYLGEHLALNGFALGFQNVVYIVIIPFMMVYPSITFVYFAASIAYLIYFYIVVFDRNGDPPVFAAIGTVLTSYIVYFTLLTVVSIAVMFYMITRNGLL